MIPEESRLQVKHKLLKKHDKVVYRRFEGVPYDSYHVRLYVEGDTKNLISVEYELHPSFPEPKQEAKNPYNGFALDIWTWGEFDVDVTFHFKDGSLSHTVYSLKYSDELPAGDNEYLNVTPRHLNKGGAVT